MIKKLITALFASLSLLTSYSAEKPEETRTATNAPENGTSKDTVIMMTNHGKITIKLNVKEAPATTKNFLRYVDENAYDGTVFHRIIPDFMVQGGGFVPTERGLKQRKTHDPIKLEADTGLLNERGTLAMARTNDENSATSQFFINAKHNAFLDRQYAVFGKVIEGMDIVDKIIKQPRGRANLSSLSRGQYVKSPAGDVPNENIIIQWVRRK